MGVIVCDLGHGCRIEIGDGIGVVRHQHREKGTPCAFAIALDRLPVRTGWIRCPTCGKIGRIDGFAWEPEGSLPTVLNVRTGAIELVTPV